ncbi:hypothetical protein Drorol1_Dr00004039, partial [Drosera rotundifolia]
GMDSSARQVFIRSSLAWQTNPQLGANDIPQPRRRWLVTLSAANLVALPPSGAANPATNPVADPRNATQPQQQKPHFITVHRHRRRIRKPTPPPPPPPPLHPRRTQFFSGSSFVQFIV